MSEDISNTDHSTWGILLWVFFEHLSPSCPLFDANTVYSTHALRNSQRPCATTQ